MGSYMSDHQVSALLPTWGHLAFDPSGTVGKPEGKTSLGISSHRWKYNIGMDVREIE
jgi:hypothetical protein